MILRCEGFLSNDGMQLACLESLQILKPQGNQTTVPVALHIQVFLNGVRLAEQLELEYFGVLQVWLVLNT